MRLLYHLVFVLPFPALADPATVVDADLAPSGDAWRVAVTIAHAETGWDDYADGWRVEAADGTVLGTRVLHHPHVDEQPFTRSLSGVEIPSGTAEVYVRARTSVEGWDGARAGPFALPGR